MELQEILSGLYKNLENTATEYREFRNRLKEKEFTAQMIVLNHPTVITAGYTPVFHIHTAQVACQVTKIEKKLDPATGQTKEENPDFVKNGDAAIVKVKPVQPLVIERQKDIPQMARFAVRDSGTTVAAGMCIDLVKK